MNIIEFIKEYPDEASCKAKFKQYREQVGVVCPKYFWKTIITENLRGKRLRLWIEITNIIWIC